MAHTGAARAAVEALTRELAAAWAPDGVSVVAVALGRFATESLRKYPAELWRSAAAVVPLQRLGEVEEYGWLVALLASPLGRRVLGLGGHARRRARQLDRRLAAGGARPRRRGARPRSVPGSGPAVARRGGAADAVAPVASAADGRSLAVPSEPAGEVLWLHRSLPSF